MEHHEARGYLEKLLLPFGSHPNPVQAIDTMLNFYSSNRIEDCDIDSGGDMLLFQWGMYDWGDGEWFDVNITRQFMFDDEDLLFQLSLTLKYQPLNQLRSLEPGNQWCASPDELSSFRDYIFNSEVLGFLGTTSCDLLDLIYEET